MSDSVRAFEKEKTIFVVMKRTGEGVGLFDLLQILKWRKSQRDHGTCSSLGHQSISCRIDRGIPKRRVIARLCKNIHPDLLLSFP